MTSKTRAAPTVGTVFTGPYVAGAADAKQCPTVLTDFSRLYEVGPIILPTLLTTELLIAVWVHNKCATHRATYTWISHSNSFQKNKTGGERL